MKQFILPVIVGVVSHELTGSATPPPDYVALAVVLNALVGFSLFAFLSDVVSCPTKRDRFASMRRWSMIAGLVSFTASICESLGGIMFGLSLFLFQALLAVDVITAPSTELSR